MIYYAGLAVIALLPFPKRKDQSGPASHKFIFIIPAHDEEKTIGEAVKSCLNLDYPKDKFDIYVVADNCSDKTSEVALSLGAKCLVRKDETRKGKGYALSYAFDQLKQMGCDAFVIIDADCVLDSHALKEVDLHMRNGGLALQMADSVSNADDNPISYALSVGNIIENRLFYVAKSRLHLPVMLRGTGMVLHKDLLQRLPWNAQSIVEDLEYSIELFRAGILVRFLDKIEVRSAFPTDRRQLNVQRERWAKGNLSFARTQGFKLLTEGLSKRSLGLLDAGCMLLFMSRPIFLTVLISAMAVSLAAWLLVHSWVTDLFLFISLALAVLCILYFGSGILLLGLTKRRLNLLCRVPVVLMHLAWISICGLVSTRSVQWNRTPR